MTLYDKYIKGETKQVYQEIYNLGQDAFHKENFTQIVEVLTETFERQQGMHKQVMKKIDIFAYQL
jgi:hypothetical protein